TGLFLGVGDSIHRAGPSVILIFIIVGFFLFLLMRALGELILSDLKKHTYIEFIEKYLGKNVGFISGYLYWISWLTLAMAELTALGIYFEYWFPHLPTWLP
ncbi:GerAB/ArcD/ProY family transporter, partial [Klebsiella pneumoniae]